MKKEQWKEVIVINMMVNVNAELDGQVADAKLHLLVSFNLNID